MNSRIFRFALASLMAFSLASMARAELDPSDRTGFRQLERAFTLDWNQHNAAALAALWVEDGDLVDPFGNAASGRAAIEQLLSMQLGPAGIFGRSRYEIKRSTYRLITSEVAVADWTVTVYNMLDDIRAPLPPQTHQVVLVLTKNASFSWLVNAARPTPYVGLREVQGGVEEELESQDRE